MPSNILLCSCHRCLLQQKKSLWESPLVPFAEAYHQQHRPAKETDML